jgi:hypothetical protein
MSDERAIKRIDSTDGKHHVEIMARDDGLFRFVETAHVTDPEEGYTYWRPTHWSGLYADQQSAERDARAILPWLRDLGN